MESKEKTLNDLYALRAGLSVISQEYDKTQAIENSFGDKLVENAETLDDNICFDSGYPELDKLQKRYGYDRELIKKLNEEKNSSASDNEPFDPKKWMAKRNKRREIIDKNNKKAGLAYAHWLAYDESTEYFEKNLKTAQGKRESVTEGNDSRTSGFSYKEESKKNKSLSIVFFLLAAILGVIIAVGFATMDVKSEITVAVILIIALIVFLILGIVNVRKAKRYKLQHTCAVSRKDVEVQTAQQMLYKLPEVRAAARAILKERDDKIAPIKESCNDFYMALIKQFSLVLDERDWAHLDLVIFELETRRADNIKEALQLVDRELQTERIQQTIVQATEQICYEIRRGFAELKETIIECSKVISAQLSAISLQLGEMSGQLSELCDGVNMSNALQAKANVTSARLLSDVHAIRYYQ